jgi:uncharacterized membrane protein
LFVYELVKYVHVVCAIVWVGGATYSQLLGLLVARSGDPTDIPKLARNFEKIGTRVFLPASILLFLAGLFLTINRWSFQQTWISIGIALWLVSVIIGAIYVGPRLPKMAAAFDAEGATSATGLGILRRIIVVSRAELVMLFVVVGLMVIKPTVA